jgi:hypothetical protein
MAILVPRWLDFSCQARLQMCPNVTMINSFFYGRFLENNLYLWCSAMFREGCRRSVLHQVEYCILGQGKINAWRARGARAWVPVNFRKCFTCMVRRAGAARARGFDSLPSLSDVVTLSFR